MDLATITRADFDAHKGSTFTMRVSADATVSLELIAIEPLSTRPGAPREAFLVRFRSAEKTGVPQATYALEHPTLGTLEMFLVPAGTDAVGMRYDAVFS